MKKRYLLPIIFLALLPSVQALSEDTVFLVQGISAFVIFLLVLALGFAWIKMGLKKPSLRNDLQVCIAPLLLLFILLLMGRAEFMEGADMFWLAVPALVLIWAIFSGPFLLIRSMSLWKAGEEWKKHFVMGLLLSLIFYLIGMLNSPFFELFYTDLLISWGNLVILGVVSVGMPKLIMFIVSLTLMIKSRQGPDRTFFWMMLGLFIVVVLASLLELFFSIGSAMIGV